MQIDMFQNILRTKPKTFQGRVQIGYRFGYRLGTNRVQSNYSEIPNSSSRVLHKNVQSLHTFALSKFDEAMIKQLIDQTPNME